MLLPIGLVITALLLVMPTTANEAPQISDKLKQRVKDSIAEFKIPPAIMNKAEDLKQHSQTAEYRQKVKGYEQRIAKIIGAEPTTDEDSQDSKPVKTDKFILFVSASMPETTLRRYAKDIAKVNGLMVLRGTIGDDRKLGPTLAFMARILKKQPYCEGLHCEFIKANVTIDPRLFSINQVKQVPALIFVQDMEFSDYIDKKEGDGLPERASAIVYGDASLKGMAGELYRLVKSERLKGWSR